jgi:hypothetical protein
MKTTEVGTIRALGRLFLDRLGAEKSGAALARRITAFAEANDAHDAAAERVVEARRRRDGTLRAIRAAAAALVRAIEELATKVANAGLGTRVRPFARFSKVTPSAFVPIGVGRRPALARKLLADLRVKARALPEEVRGAAGGVDAAATALDAALAEITTTELAHRRALDERRPLAAAWFVALARLKRMARLVWEEHPRTYDLVFAPPPAGPKRRKPRGAAGATAAPPGAAGREKRKRRKGTRTRG